MAELRVEPMSLDLERVPQTTTFRMNLKQEKVGVAIITSILRELVLFLIKCH